jgi:hypothetical protein
VKKKITKHHDLVINKNMETHDNKSEIIFFFFLALNSCPKRAVWQTPLLNGVDKQRALSSASSLQTHSELAPSFSNLTNNKKIWQYEIMVEGEWRE